MKPAKYIQITLILLALLVFCGFSAQKSAGKTAYAHNGILDLSGWDFSADGSVKLDGEWEFYFNKLIAPGEFTNTANILTGYCHVPAYWTEYQGLGLPSKGYATYRLIIETNGKEKHLSILTPEIYTEYSLWINGELIDANGSFANKNTTYLNPSKFDFQTDSSQIEIVLQVKNSLHVYAGIGQSLSLGAPSKINTERDLKTAVDLFLISICFSAGVYHLILYFYRRKGRELIFFFILCLAVSVRGLLSNETLLMEVFPNLPFFAGSKIVTLTVPICVIFMLLYTYELYKEDVPKPVFYVFLLTNALYSIIVLASSSYYYSQLFMYYLYTGGAACLFGIYVSVRVAVKKRKGSVCFIIGMLLFVASAMTDIFSFRHLINFVYILPAGLFAFIVMQVLLLTKRYAEAYRDIENLSESLQASLDKIMNTETAFFSAQMKPHFIYNALNTIAECCESDPQEAERLILSLSKYLRGTLDFEHLGGKISLAKELELVRAYTSIEQARFENIKVEFEIDADLQNMRIPPLTIQPLVENAIKHGLRKSENGGTVKVRAYATADGFSVCVEDNGAGIPETKIESLLNPPADGSAGIGLYNINTRLLRLYGKGLNIKSSFGDFTIVCFEIPSREER